MGWRACCRIGDTPWEGTCHEKGHVTRRGMLWGDAMGGGLGVRPSLGAQVQHNQQPHWLCPEWAGSTVGPGHVAVGAVPLSHPRGTHVPIPLPLCRCTHFPIEVPWHCCSLSRWETSPGPPSALQKNPQKTKTREERNKQTNPFPLLAWHLLTAFALLIREAAGIISNKPLLMKFRAADPGGAPRRRFSETLIKFSARRCIWLGGGRAVRLPRPGTVVGPGLTGAGRRRAPCCATAPGTPGPLKFGAERRDWLQRSCCPATAGVVKMRHLIHSLTELPAGRVSPLHEQRGPWLVLVPLFLFRCPSRAARCLQMLRGLGR